ncbi:hypothetical protein [Actinoplanes utahensis]|uniref:PknH-like extracellular domain-containing protein n=1 Tax=Actinoplanes utahensis TaxID=1869 RepID=A0A0A6UJY2_ACTUT|nr:hypothetical protein [Actinoplanes utahensis]KHD76420.1 hypothetical protein MB27_17060 [Actinoplanes utahensis]GIF29801.1 hypothetical protein Aut01nite_27870 [Actinoplanes utahensis]
MLVFRVFLAAVLALFTGVTAAYAAAGPPAAGIPDAAMIQPDDLGGARPYAADDESFPALRPPRPCGLAVRAPVADRAVSAVIDVDQGPEVVLEYVALHRPGGARDYLRDLRTALRTCDDDTWRLLVTAPDRLVLRWTRSWEHVGEQITHHTFVAIARTGPTIVLVADAGWETGDGDRDRAEKVLSRALPRAAVLR